MAGTNLLPCPFCGGEAKPSGERFENTILSWVYCTRCSAAGGYRHTEAEAIEAWNSRAERTCELTLDGTDGCFGCSECDENIPPLANYCPNCGCKVVS